MLSTKTFERLVAFIHVVAFLIPVRRLCFNIYRLSTESVAHSIRFLSTRIFLSFTLLLLEIRSRQPRLYRIIVLHENSNLCRTDSEQLWVLEALPLICPLPNEAMRWTSQSSCFRRTSLLYPNPKVRRLKKRVLHHKTERYQSLKRLFEDGQTCFTGGRAGGHGGGSLATSYIWIFYCRWHQSWCAQWLKIHHWKPI